MKYKMNWNILELKKAEFILFGLVLLGFILRVYNLDFQSLWVDEIHTMIESAPQMPLGKLFDYLKYHDQHPPLFYFLERILFSVFGTSAIVARSLSAVAGTLCIWVMYLLGRELYNKRVGIIAAFFTSINYFCIYYSQEARSYMLAFLFVCLSFLFLIKLIKNLSTTNAVWYSGFVLAMIYTHYFCLFILVSQCFIVFILGFAYTNDKPKFFKTFAICFLVIGIVYSIWIPFLLEVANINTYWVTSVSTSFASDYFFEYFGDTGLLKPFLLLFLISYFINLIHERNIVKISSDIFGFVILSLWIFISYFIPFLRSVFVVPMLASRYTIIVLPAILLMLSSGVSFIKNTLIRNLILVLFLVVSLTDILFVKKYYTTIRKTQFRELTEYIAKHYEDGYAIISPKSSWHFSYYAYENGISKNLLIKDSENIIDLVNKIKTKKGFWLVGAHSTPKVREDELKNIYANYVLVKSLNFFDAWAQLYERRSGLTNIQFDKSLLSTVNNEQVITLWGGQIQSLPIHLKKGKYSMKIISRGTSSEKEFPRIKVLLNDTIIGHYTATDITSSIDFHFDVHTMNNIVKIEMMNDYTNPKTKEDRNLFINQIIINQFR